MIFHIIRPHRAVCWREEVISSH